MASSSVREDRSDRDGRLGAGVRNEAGRRPGHIAIGKRSVRDPGVDLARVLEGRSRVERHEGVEGRGARMREGDVSDELRRRPGQVGQDPGPCRDPEVPGLVEPLEDPHAPPGALAEPRQAKPRPAPKATSSARKRSSRLARKKLRRTTRDSPRLRSGPQRKPRRRLSRPPRARCRRRASQRQKGSPRQGASRPRPRQND
jgi:hypothetical protein